MRRVGMGANDTNDPQEIEALMTENSALKDENAALKAEMKKLKAEIKKGKTEKDKVQEADPQKVEDGEK